jgi:hypothetical protein
VPNQSFDSVSPFTTIFLPISHFAVAKLIWGKPSDGCDRALVSQVMIGSISPPLSFVTLWMIFF